MAIPMNSSHILYFCITGVRVNRKLKQKHEEMLLYNGPWVLHNWTLRFTVSGNFLKSESLVKVLINILCLLQVFALRKL